MCWCWLRFCCSVAVHVVVPVVVVLDVGRAFVGMLGRGGMRRGRVLSCVRGGRCVVGLRVRGSGQLRKSPTYGGRRKASRSTCVCTWGEALVASPHKLCGSRKSNGLLFLLPIPFCSFVFLGLVRASPSSPRHRSCRLMHGWTDLCKTEGFWIMIFSSPPSPLSETYDLNTRSKL